MDRCSCDNPMYIDVHHTFSQTLGHIAASRHRVPFKWYTRWLIILECDGQTILYHTQGDYGSRMWWKSIGRGFAGFDRHYIIRSISTNRYNDRYIIRVQRQIGTINTMWDLISHYTPHGDIPCNVYGQCTRYACTIYFPVPTNLERRADGHGVERVMWTTRSAARPPLAHLLYTFISNVFVCACF